jgi:hypothetical protein
MLFVLLLLLLAQDCVHFDFGDGTCPFGTSCFYRHAYRDGRLEVRVLAGWLAGWLADRLSVCLAGS